jgi:hypothetical protein
LRFLSRLPFILLLVVLAGACDGSSQSITVPSVVIIAPQNGQVVSGTATFEATVESELSIARVIFVVDGEEIGEDDEAPYRLDWDTGPWADGGDHTLLATAEDFGGNLGFSEYVVVRVSP